MMGPRPMSSPARMAASRMPVPVAESQLKVKTAASAVGAATTGGMRWITVVQTRND